MQKKPFDSGLRNSDPAVVHAKQIASELLDTKKVMIPDFPLPGVRYLDFYRTFDKNVDVRNAAIECLKIRYSGYDIDAIAGIGNGGFTLAACLALVLDLPFHPIRKAGDTVHNAYFSSVGMVYAKRELTLAKDIIEKGTKVVLVDDTIATGGSFNGGVELIEMADAQVVEIATLFETISKGGRNAVAPIPVFSILSRQEF